VCPGPVPKGRLKVAQHASAGFAFPTETSPAGTTDDFPGRESWVNADRKQMQTGDQRVSLNSWQRHSDTLTLYPQRSIA
jgi:hypothetical protein